MKKRKLAIDGLIEETDKCKHFVGLYVSVGPATQRITLYKPKNFVKQLRKFRKVLLAHKLKPQDYEVELGLHGDRMQISFRPHRLVHW